MFLGLICRDIKRERRSVYRIINLSLRIEREVPLCAQPVNSDFTLRVLAARNFLHTRQFSCRGAAGKPAIHDIRSKNESPNSQVADKG
jgi:hypothetical protein